MRAFIILVGFIWAYNIGFLKANSSADINNCSKRINCLNNGTFNQEKCSCDCLTNYIGNDCSIDLCYNDHDINCRNRQKCLGNISNDRYEDACSNNEECLKSGRGSYCCFKKSASFCQFNLADSHKKNVIKTKPDCILFEDIYIGKRLELWNGDSFDNLRYDKDRHGYKSIELGKNCVLLLCHENLFGRKTCINHAFRKDEYKLKKYFPKFISCICNEYEYERGRFIQLPVHLSSMNMNNIKLPKLHNDQFTVRFKIKSSLPIEPYIIKLNSIEVLVSNEKIDLLTNSYNLFKQVNLVQNVNINQDIWISFRLTNNDNSFIKFGYDQTAESNTLLTLKGPFLLSNQFNLIDIDKKVSLDGNYSIEYKSFDGDPSPFITNFYNKRSSSMHITQLPVQVELLYNIIKNFKIDIQHDLEKIKYSFFNKNCILNQNSKRVIYKKSNTLIKFELWPSNKNEIQYEKNTIQLIKVIYGSFKFEWLNINNDNRTIREELVSQNDTLWSTPEYYSKYKVTNLNKNDISIIIRGIYYLDSTSLINTQNKYLNNLESIINRYKSEFDRNICDSVLHQNRKKCSFIGTKCGSSLNYMLDNNIKEDSLYTCDIKNGKLFEIEDCFNMNKTCLNDEGCYFNRKILAIVKLVSAYNITNKNNELNQFNEISGNILFDQYEDHVKIRGVFRGLRPNSYHAIHIHEYGELGNNCRDTGPHFNPYHSYHSSPNELIKHAGDLGNIRTNKGGFSELKTKSNSFNIYPDNFLSILYRTIVIHINKDDLGKLNDDNSKSNGNSGKRIACGLILPVN